MTKRQEKTRLAEKNRRQGALVKLGRAAIAYVGYHHECIGSQACSIRPYMDDYKREFERFLIAARRAVVEGGYA